MLAPTHKWKIQKETPNKSNFSYLPLLFFSFCLINCVFQSCFKKNLRNNCSSCLQAGRYSSRPVSVKPRKLPITSCIQITDQALSKAGYREIKIKALGNKPGRWRRDKTSNGLEIVVARMVRTALQPVNYHITNSLSTSNVPRLIDTYTTFGNFSMCYHAVTVGKQCSRGNIERATSLHHESIERKHEANGWFLLVGESAASFLQCFNTVGWSTGKTSSL